MRQVRFRARDGITLEGEVREADPPVRGTAVLCHPHPKYGGSKDHPVLWAVRNELAGKRHLTVLSFNFRGVLGSEGRYSGWRGGLADTAAAVDAVRNEAEGPTVMVGWSFGATMSLRHALVDERIAALVLIAIPLGDTARGGARLPTLGELERLTAPVLLVAGDADGICPVGNLRNLARWVPHGEVKIVPGTDHFFGRREREVAAAAGAFFEEVLSTAERRGPSGPSSA
ncbi:MAG TPA: alpha/beta fold hydrolase [Actinomycetota bacterium]|nr:alpha/beta fold hydrolase [Actinomycetota bacterium]